MQAIRTTTRRLPTIKRTIPSSSYHTKPNMSFFPVALQELSPLFRIIDEASRPQRQCTPRAAFRPRSFQPKFDVKELSNSYELVGELPGIDQKDISIEWTEGNTLTISGRSESRVEESSTSPASAPATTETVSEEKQAETPSYHAPSVEEEDDGELISKPTESETETITSTPEKTPETNTEVPDPEVSAPTVEQARYWVSERTSGSFSRGFRFPVRIEQEGVKASLKNGILSIVVPKAKIPEPRRIVIE
jgi:HSP20 family molecular chaperone IbpA